MRFGVVAFVVLCACRSAAPTSLSRDATNEDRPQKKPLSLTDRAEAILDRVTSDQYERPFTRQGWSIEMAANLFEEACKNGDAPACWKAHATTLSGDVFDNRHPILNEIRRHCLAGHVSSCAALHDRRKQLPAMAPGAAGRLRCTLEFGCDELAIKECTAGFAASCLQQAERVSSPKDATQLRSRGFRLAREGCTQGMLQACSVLHVNGTDDDKLDMFRMMCRYDAGHCHEVGNGLIDRGEREAARDAFEKACQQGSDLSCLYLGYSYVNGRLLEPVAGRGHALLALKCPAAKPREVDFCDGYPQRKAAAR